MTASAAKTRWRSPLCTPLSERGDSELGDTERCHTERAVAPAMSQKLSDVDTLVTNLEALELVRDAAAAAAPNATAGMAQLQEKMEEYMDSGGGGGARMVSVEDAGRLLEALKPHGLTQREQMQLLNMCPHTTVELHLVVEQCEERLSAETIQQIVELFQPYEPEEEEDDDDEEEGEDVEDDQ